MTIHHDRFMAVVMARDVPLPAFKSEPRKAAKAHARIPLVTFRGATQTLADWCRELKLDYGVVFQRYRRGWPVERMFSPAMFREARK